MTYKLMSKGIFEYSILDRKVLSGVVVVLRGGRSRGTAPGILGACYAGKPGPRQSDQPASEAQANWIRGQTRLAPGFTTKTGSLRSQLRVLSRTTSSLAGHIEPNAVS